MSAPKRRFNCLTLQEKLDIINAVENGTNRKAIMAQYQLPPSTLSCLLRQRDQLLTKMTGRTVSPTTKRIRALDSPELEERMKAFVNECRKNGVALTGSLILCKAKAFAVTLGLTSFRASNGWLSNFKKRQGIYSRKKKVTSGLTKTDQITKVIQEECSTCEHDDAESTTITDQDNGPENDELSVPRHDTHGSGRDEIKMEAVDIDDNTDTHTDDDCRLGEDNLESKIDIDFVDTAGALGSRAEDEFDNFGKYIASALRRMPGRMSIVARTDLQNTLAQVQMRCLEQTD